MNRKILTKFVITVLLIGSLIIWKYNIADEIMINEMRSYLHGYGVYMPLAYIVTISIASNLFVPMSVMIISGGLMFGGINGFLYSFLGAGLSAIVGYLFYNKLKMRFSNERIKTMMEAIKRRGALTIIVIRFMTIPFTAQNLMGSMLNMPFRTYLIGSLIGMTPWLIGFSFFGDSILRMKYHFMILSGVLLIALYWTSLRLNKAS